MFTGLIEAVGRVKTLRAVNANNYEMEIVAELSSSLSTGDSIAVNGVCLTVTQIFDRSFTVYLSRETAEKTHFTKLEKQTVNLERALTVTGRLDGHFVQGHVDCTAVVREIKKKQDDHVLVIDIPEKFSRYLVAKGSIAVNGISLTIMRVRQGLVDISIIPHTWGQTQLTTLAQGSVVNIEIDILAKYIYAFVRQDRTGDKKDSGALVSLLQENGFYGD